MVEPGKQIPKACSRCGQRFGCTQGEPGCWCEAVIPRRETLAEIRAVATDCICPACLSAFAEKDHVEREAATEVTAKNSNGTIWAKALPHSAVRSRGVSAVWGFIAL